MTELGISILITAIVTGALTAYAVIRITSRRRSTDSRDEALTLLQQRLDTLAQSVDGKLSEINRLVGDQSRTMHESMRSQWDDSRSVLREMTNHLTQVEKSVTGVYEKSDRILDIGDRLRDLEKVLKHQKQRGNLGEASLTLVLENILPPDAYHLQHTFADGAIVDAIIRTKEGTIPIDAKFSLDNYNRLVSEEDENRRESLAQEFKKDLKRRIDETARYIRPKEGTLPFAFMYIPAEAIYYDLLVNKVGATSANARDLIDYAYTDKNVIIVSPTTFAAYLQSVLYGFRAFKIEESAKSIRTNVELLDRHLAAYEDYFKRIGKSLQTTVNHYNHADRELGKVNKDVLRITGEGRMYELEPVDRPAEREG